MRLSVILLLGVCATPALAQNGVRSPQGLSIGIAAGGSAFTDFQRSNFQAQQLSTSGLQEQEMSRRISAHTSGSVAANIAFWPVSSWGLRIQGSYTPSRFRELVSGSGGQTSETTPSTMAALGIFTYQAQALFRLPTIKGRVMPYGIVGGGAIHYSASSGAIPENVGSEFSSGSLTKAAASVGAGAMLQTRRRGWGLNFELIDNISKTPLAAGPVHHTSSLSFTVGLSVLVHQK